MLESVDLDSNRTSQRVVQPLNALLPILVTLSGILIEVRLNEKKKMQKAIVDGDKVKQKKHKENMPKIIVVDWLVTQVNIMTQWELLAMMQDSVKQALTHFN